MNQLETKLRMEPEPASYAVFIAGSPGY